MTTASMTRWAISGTAAAASSLLTVTRTSCEPDLVLDRHSEHHYFRRRLERALRGCLMSCFSDSRTRATWCCRGERVLSGAGHAYDRQSKVVQRCEGLWVHHPRWRRQGLLRPLQLHFGQWLQDARR